MKLLLLNTCGAEGSIALADTDREDPIAAAVSMPGRTASERLVAVVREAIAQQGWHIRDLATIAVVTGPGSFTGVRVGLAAAKGLSEASGVPIIGLSRLAVLAASARPEDGRVCTLLDAGRNEFYCGEFSGSVELKQALLAKADAIAAAKFVEAVVVCEESVARSFSEMGKLHMVAEPTAADALPFVLKRIELGIFDDPMSLDANYLRRTDAEIFAKPAPRAAV